MASAGRHREPLEATMLQDLQGPSSKERRASPVIPVSVDVGRRTTETNDERDAVSMSAEGKFAPLGIELPAGRELDYPPRGLTIIPRSDVISSGPLVTGYSLQPVTKPSSVVLKLLSPAPGASRSKLVFRAQPRGHLPAHTLLVVSGVLTKDFAFLGSVLSHHDEEVSDRSFFLSTSDYDSNHWKMTGTALPSPCSARHGSEWSQGDSTSHHFLCSTSSLLPPNSDMTPVMRPPPLIFSNHSSYSTRFCDDPWNGDEDDNGPPTASSSRTSSECSHVVPESAFMGANGRYLVDPFLGQHEAARLSAGYIIKTFNCREESETSKRLQQPSLSVFIAQLIYLTDAPSNTVISALILLQRFRAKLPSNSTSFGFSGHLLWLGAFIIACNEDSLHGAIKNARSASYWSELTLFSEREVDEIYQELWNQLDGNVTVFPSYASALEKLKNPISIAPSWHDETPQWTFDADADDCESDTASFSESGYNRKFVGVGAHPPPAYHSKSSSSSKPKFQCKPNDPTATSSSNSSPSSLRTRGVTSRLAAFFKKKD